MKKKSRKKAGVKRKAINKKEFVYVVLLVSFISLISLVILDKVYDHYDIDYAPTFSSATRVAPGTPITPTEILRPIIGFSLDGAAVVGPPNIWMCDNFLCNSPFIISLDNGQRHVGDHPRSISVERDGNKNPILAYTSKYTLSQPINLEVVYCNDPACTTFINTTVAYGPPNNNHYGAYPEINFLNGLPIIAYSAFNQAKLVMCSAPDCSSSTIKILSPVGTWGRFMSSDVYQGKSYFSFVNGRETHIALCTDPTCNTIQHSMVYNVSDNQHAQSYTSIEIDPNGNPYVAFIQSNATGTPSGYVNLLHCSNSNCDISSGGTITRIVLDEQFGSEPFKNLDMELAGTGFPIIGYYNTVNFQYNVIQCNDATCDVNLLTKTSLSLSSAVHAQSPAMALGVRGMPAITYSMLGSLNEELHLIQCKDTSCSQREPEIVTPTLNGEPANLDLG
ncbi:hypothetical protein HN876_00705 [archaeon]|nr:hypothetical protein [archaeon]MBT6606410.1 hypothetical protein [archaeon]MBT7251421.1 hypothetical protein [archaeon]